jgi:hypothetical protein
MDFTASQAAAGVMDEGPGIIPRVLHLLFERASSELQLRVRASYLEVYNEQVVDLLHPSAGPHNIRYSVKRGFFVQVRASRSLVKNNITRGIQRMRWRFGATMLTMCYACSKKARGTDT